MIDRPSLCRYVARAGSESHHVMRLVSTLPSSDICSCVDTHNPLLITQLPDSSKYFLYDCGTERVIHIHMSNHNLCRDKVDRAATMQARLPIIGVSTCYIIFAVVALHFFRIGATILHKHQQTKIDVCIWYPIRQGL